MFGLLTYMSPNFMVNVGKYSVNIPYMDAWDMFFFVGQSASYHLKNLSKGQVYLSLFVTV